MTHFFSLYLFVQNPHSDSQAMDRVHRIGQTKTVLVYRLATASSVEMRVLERANAKKKLEKVVIHSGLVKKSKDEGQMSLEELNSLLKDDLDLKMGSEYEGICDKELKDILSRDSSFLSTLTKGQGYEVVNQEIVSLIGSVE
jgi:ATP-dependent DNA helicase